MLPQLHRFSIRAVHPYFNVSNKFFIVTGPCYKLLLLEWIVLLNPPKGFTTIWHFTLRLFIAPKHVSYLILSIIYSQMLYLGWPCQTSCLLYLWLALTNSRWFQEKRRTCNTFSFFAIRSLGEASTRETWKTCGNLSDKNLGQRFRINIFL